MTGRSGKSGDTRRQVALRAKKELEDAGMEVVYIGNSLPREIVLTAIQEDVDVIGLSILSGAHPILFPKIIRLLRKNKAGDIPVIAGGIIPEKDIARMKKVGIQEIFLPGTSTQAIVEWITGRLEKPKKVK